MPLYSVLQVLSGVKAETVSNVLPKELSVVVNDLSADMPTHMLVVYSRQVPAAGHALPNAQHYFRVSLHKSPYSSVLDSCYAQVS